MNWTVSVWCGWSTQYFNNLCASRHSNTCTHPYLSLSSPHYKSSAAVIVDMSQTEYGAISISPGKKKPSRVSKMPDIYCPSYDSPDRVSPIYVGVFNVLNTCVGGGTLSLPFAFAQCGWGFALFFVLFSMLCTMFSMVLLCTMARKLGCSSYSDIMEITLGNRGKRISTALLFGMLCLVIIAFLVLLRDIAGDIVEFFTPETYSLSIHIKNLITIILTAICFPLMTADNLHALRYVSYAGTTCVIILLYTIAEKAIATNLAKGDDVPRVLRAGPERISDVFSALPIIFISFLCQFNVNGVYSDLREPSSSNMNTVIYTSMGSAATLFTCFGMAGYLFAFDDTADNILNNFSSRDPALLLARVGLMLTLMCQLPMVVVPCRKAFYPLVWPTVNTADTHSQYIHHPELHINDIEDLNRSNSQPQESARERLLSAASAHSDIGGEGITFVPVDEGYDVVVNSSSSRYLITLLIISITLIISETVPGVSTVWTVAGSTVSIVIAFLLPAYAYVAMWNGKLSDNREVDMTLAAAYGLIALSVLLITLCTVQTAHKIFFS